MNSWTVWIRRPSNLPLSTTLIWTWGPQHMTSAVGVHYHRMLKWRRQWVCPKWNRNLSRMLKWCRPCPLSRWIVNHRLLPRRRQTRWLPMKIRVQYNRLHRGRPIIDCSKPWQISHWNTATIHWSWCPISGHWRRLIFALALRDGTGSMKRYVVSYTNYSANSHGNF